MTFTRYGECPTCGGVGIEEVDCDLGGKVVGFGCMDFERHEFAINRQPLTPKEADVFGVEDADAPGNLTEKESKVNCQYEDLPIADVSPCTAEATEFAGGFHLCVPHTKVFVEAWADQKEVDDIPRYERKTTQVEDRHYVQVNMGDTVYICRPNNWFDEIYQLTPDGFKKVGERLDPNTPCDVLVSYDNVGKGFPSFATTDKQLADGTFNPSDDVEDL